MPYLDCAIEDLEDQNIRCFYIKNNDL